MNQNKAVAEILNKLSEYYQYLGKEERFRARAYANAAMTIQNMKEPIETIASSGKKLDELKGVGIGISEKIVEYLQTGKLGIMQELRKKVPVELMPLMSISGIGPATIRKIHEDLKFETIREFEIAMKKDFISMAKVLHRDKAAILMEELTKKWDEKRLPLDKVKILAAALVTFIRNLEGVQQVYVAGSIRRKKSTVGDIDIVVIIDEKKEIRLLKEISAYPEIKQLLVKGDRKISFILNQYHFRVDIRLFRQKESGTALLYFTGPKEHNIALRKRALKLGYSLNEYGLIEKSTKRKISFEEESEVYNKLGLVYIIPEKRNANLIPFLMVKRRIPREHFAD